MGNIGYTGCTLWHTATMPKKRPRPTGPSPSQAMGRQIVAFRSLRANMTRQTLADACDIPFGTLERYETGKRDIPYGDLFLIATALETTVAEMEGRARKDNPASFMFLDAATGEDLSPGS